MTTAAMRDPTFTSSFLEKLNGLVQSIDPGKLPARPDTSDFSTSGILPDRNQFDLFGDTSSISSSFQDSESDAESLASPPPSPPPLAPPPRAPQKLTTVPRLSLEVCRSEMDDRLEEIERAIDALIMHWERWPGTGDDDTRLATGKMSKWRQGHPLDLNDEYLHEDPSYDDTEVEREALQDYQAEHREVCAPSDVEPAGNPKQDADSLACGSRVKDASREWPVSKHLARLPCGKWVPLKKLSVSLRRLHVPPQEPQKELGNSPDTDTASEGEEAAMLLRWKSSAQRKEPNKNSQSMERSKRLRQYKVTQYFGARERLGDHPKVAGGHGQVGSESSCSSSLESRSSKRYPFRQRQKTVPYTAGSGEDEGDGSENAWQCSEDSSEEDVPSEEEEVRPSAPVRNLRRKKSHGAASRRYTCPECGQEFNNSSNMWKHVRIHKGEKPYACQECGKSYSDPSNLARHQQAHRGERHHRCSLCPKAYYLKHQLDAHFRSHKGIRAFSCLECESSFFSRVELLRHMKIHVFGKGGHPPQSEVRCEDCGQTYPSRRCLQRHRRRHRRFECEICGEYFTLKYKYKFHKSCHSDPCERCGVVGLHLCESQRLKGPIAQDVSAASRVKGQLPNAGRGPPKTSDKPTLKLPCPKTPSVPTRPFVPIDGRKGPPNPVGSASPKESSDPVKGPPNPSGSGKLMVRLLRPKKSSALTCPPVPMDGREELPNPVVSASPKESSEPIPGPTEPAQQPKSSPLIIPILPADQTAKPDPVVAQANSPARQSSENAPLRCPETLPQCEPLQTDQVTTAKPRGPSRVQKSPLPAPTSFLVPAQVVRGPGVGPTDGAALNQNPPPMVLMVVANSGPLPAGGSVRNVPILHTVNPSQPSVKEPREQWGVAPPQAQLLPGDATHVQSLPPRGPVLIANSNPGPLAFRISANDPLSAPSGSSPAEDLIVINSATLPPGTKITLEIPARKIVPSTPPPQMCHLCGVKYLGEHRCKMPLSEPVRRSEQETSQSGLQGKKNIIISQERLAAAQQPRSLVQLTSQDGQEPSATQSCNFQEAHSEIIHIDGEEGSHGVDKGPSSTKTYDFKEGQPDVIYMDGKEESHGVDQGPSSTRTYDFRKTRSETIYIDGKEGSHMVDQGPSSTKTYDFQKAHCEMIYVDGKEGSHGVDQGPSSTNTYDFQKAHCETIYIDGKEGSHGVDQESSSTKTYDFQKAHSETIYIDGKEGSHAVDQGPSSTKTYDFQKVHSEMIYIDVKEGSHGVDQESSSSKTYDLRKAHCEMIYIDGKEGSHGVDQESSSSKTYDLRKARSEVTYADGEEGSDTERDTDSDWPVEDEEASEAEDETLVVSNGKKHHRRSSSGERGPAKRRKGSYSCHLCNKRFVYKRSLKQHLRLHRAFSCGQCSASYVRSEQLKWHQNTHGIR